MVRLSSPAIPELVLIRNEKVDKAVKDPQTSSGIDRLRQWMNLGQQEAGQDAPDPNDGIIRESE